MEEERNGIFLCVPMKNGNIYTDFKYSFKKICKHIVMKKALNVYVGKGPLNLSGLVKLTIHNVVQDVTRL